MSGGGPGDLMARIRAAERAQRQREAIERTEAVQTGAVPRPRTVDDAPDLQSARQVGGEKMALGEDEGRPTWFLEGRRVDVGDAIEVYTNAANGWMRGRFEWSGSPHEAPRLALNLWDPNGERDEDGLPPWIGELTAPLPKRAICRWPARRTRGS